MLAYTIHTLMGLEQLSEKEQQLVLELKEKYEAEGEGFADHLEGLIYSDYINYWDYIGIDALLNLQKPKTQYSDEMIFIIYHQITELYFKIIIHELEKIGYEEDLNKSHFLKHLNRINKYFHHLVYSFDALIQGMEPKQFLAFRTALTPASGFQSIQYRLIELWSTKFVNLLSKDHRSEFDNESRIRDMYPYLYWNSGATERKSGKKTLTLRQFESKYRNLIIRKGKEFVDKNICIKFSQLNKDDQMDEELREALKLFDVNANVNWPLTHYRYAAKYLKKGSHVAKSTGGTNWQEYLPPHFQKQVFYPELWSAEELNNWGKSWVLQEMMD